MSNPNTDRDERVKLNERCEWNPVLRIASSDPPRDTDCRNETWWSIGHGDRNFHVCNSCAKLPEFKLRSRRDPVNANPAIATADASSPDTPDRLWIIKSPWGLHSQWTKPVKSRGIEYVHNDLVNHAAARMREACVEKVREIDSPSDTATDFDVAYRNGFESARDAAIEALQSLTLEGEQEKRQW